MFSWTQPLSRPIPGLAAVLRVSPTSPEGDFGRSNALAAGDSQTERPPSPALPLSRTHQPLAHGNSPRRQRITRHSLEEVGGFFGGRDHSTVLYAVSKISGLVDREPATAELLSRILERLGERPL